MTTENNLDIINITALTSFTPTLTGAGTAGTTTYTTQQGYYQRFGNLIVVYVWIAISAATGTGDVLIGGLPFTIKSRTNGNLLGPMRLSASNTLVWPTNTQQPIIYGLNNTTTCKILGIGSSATSGALFQLASASISLRFELMYQV